MALFASASVLVLCSGCRDSEPERDRAAFEVDNVYARGPVTVRVRLDKTNLTIAQTLLLQLEAGMPPAYEIQMPKVDEALRNFGLVDWDHLGRRLDKNNNVITTYQYELEPFLSGEYEIPAFTFVFHDVNEPDVTHKLISEPIGVQVASLLGEDRAKLVIHDIEDVVDVPTKASWWWLWLLGSVCVVGIAVGGLFLLLRPPRQPTGVYMSAHEIAYANLRALVERKLIEQGKIKEFYERISGILRHYIEHRFDLRAPERTTEEFLAELGTTNALAEPDKAVLKEFLTHCDLVKFARHDPTTEQIQQTFDLVKDFIERTKSDEPRVAVVGVLAAAATGETEVA